VDVGPNVPDRPGSTGAVSSWSAEEIEVVGRRNVVRSAVVATVFVVAGCGSDDAALTKQEWLGGAEAICADMIAQEDEIAEPQNVEEMAEALDRFVEITSGGIDELKALSAPDGDEEIVGGIIEAFEGLAAAGSDFVEAVVASGSLDEMTPEVEAAFRDLEMAQQQAQQTAVSYGLTGCFPESSG
jgi:hypothetical protein